MSKELSGGETSAVQEERDRGMCMKRVGGNEGNRGKKEREGVSRSLVHSTVTSRLSGCCGQPDMMSYAVELGLGGGG